LTRRIWYVAIADWAFTQLWLVSNEIGQLSWRVFSIQLYALFPGGGGYQGKSSRLMNDHLLLHARATQRPFKLGPS
jgi:hypothetical protein